jgi:hypothetical protein
MMLGWRWKKMALMHPESFRDGFCVGLSGFANPEESGQVVPFV